MRHALSVSLLVTLVVLLPSTVNCRAQDTAYARGTRKSGHPVIIDILEDE